MRMMIRSIALSALLGACLPVCSAAARPGYDELLLGVPFKPLVMGGRAVGAQGWFIWDARTPAMWKRFAKNDAPYLSGDDCFRLTIENGTLKFVFAKANTVNKDYWGKSIQIINFSPAPNENLVPAPAYEVSGRFRLSSGSLLLPGRKFEANNGQWQTFSYRLQNYNGRGWFSIAKAEPEQVLEIADYSFKPVYPIEKDAAIHLPDGGRLTRILMPANASGSMRLGLLAWRAWLWKLTGAALPIEVTANVTRQPGALSVVRGKTARGGWHIDVNKNGIHIVCSEDDVLIPAALEYMRTLGASTYAQNFKVIPKPNRNLVLSPVSEKVAPKFANCVFPAFEYVFNGFRPGNYLSSSINWYYGTGNDPNHFSNTFLPFEIYGKEHPEYWSLKEDGTREKESLPFFMSPCLSNKEARAIIVKNFTDALNSNPGLYSMIQLCLGDYFRSCQCRSCAAETKDGSMTDLFLSLQNEMAKANPGITVEFCAYSKYRLPPEKVKPEKNVAVNITIEPFFFMDCQAHIDCPLNRRYIKRLERWCELAGGRENVGITLYDDARPYRLEKLLDFFSKYAGNTFHHHTNLDIDTAAYRSGRWNYGKNTPEEMARFHREYYGPGGKYVAQAYQDLEKWCENYKHTPEELSTPTVIKVFTPSPQAFKTIMNREILDASYVLLDKALAAPGASADQTRHIQYEKFKFLANDFSKYDRASCTSGPELAAFARRVADFVRLADALTESNDYALAVTQDKLLRTQMSPRQWIERIAGITVPKTCSRWTREPALAPLLKNPEKFFTFGAAKIKNGWHFAPHALVGGDGPLLYGYECPPRVAKLIRRKSSGQGNVAALLQLDKTVVHPTILTVEGLDDDKPGVSTFKITVNGSVIYSGANAFPEHSWGRMSFTVPAGLLKAGENRIEFENTVPDLPSDRKKVQLTDANGMDLGASVRMDYSRGWLALSNIWLLNPNEELAAALAHQPSACYTGGELEPGKDGKNFSFSEQNGRTHYTYLQCGGWYEDLALKFGAPNGGAIKVSALLRGDGRIRFYVYSTGDFPKKGKAKWLSNACLATVTPAEGDKKFEQIIKLPKETAHIILFMHGTSGNVTLKSVVFEPVAKP